MLTVGMFTERIGSRFRIEPGPPGQAVDVELVEATVAGRRRPGADEEPFSLIFRGPKDVHLPQRMYRLVHDTMGAMEIFLVPIGPDAQGMQFQAVFT